MRWLTLLVVLLATVAVIHCADEVENEDTDGSQEIEEDDDDDDDEEEQKREEWEEDGVTSLTTDNFETYITENEFVLVEFYAPWCGHCKNFAPEYAKLATEMEQISSPIKVVKVDGSKENKFVEKYGVRGFPTLQLFRNGSPREYTGAKETTKIVDWLNKKTGPLAVDIKDVKSAEEFIESNDAVVFGFFDDHESEEAGEFLKAADSIDAYKFGITSNQDVYKKYEAKSGSVILFKNYDDGKAVFDGELTEKEIQKFVAINAAPLVIDFGRTNTHVVFSVVKNHLLIFVSKKEGHMEKYIEPAKEAAKAFRGEVLFVAIDCDANELQQIVSFFKLQKDEVPTMRLVHFVDETKINKYKPAEADLSPAYMKSFVQDGKDGKLKVELNGQALPEDWDKTPVKTLVSSNFEEVVFDKEKDVFVSFYSPWSDDSQTLAPIFDELGEKYKDSKTVVIAKFDAMSNELDEKHPKIISYPTLKFYKKGDNSVAYYAGKKTLDALVKFVESGGEDVEYEEEKASEEKPVVEDVEEEEEDEEEYKDEL